MFLNPNFQTTTKKDSTSIAALTGSAKNLVTSFRIISIVCSVLTMYLLLFFLRSFVHDWRLRLGLCFLYLLHWKLAVRSGFWLPINTDPMAILCITTLLVACQQIRAETRKNLWIALSAVAIGVGVLNRSSMFPYALALILCTAHSPQARSFLERAFEKAKNIPTLLLFAPLAVGLAAYFYVRHVAVVTGSYGAEYLGSSLLFGIKLASTRPIGDVIYSIYNYWGPLIVLLLWRYRTTSGVMSDQWHLVYIVLVSLAFSFVALDFRLITYAFPIFLALVGIVIQENPVLLGKKQWLLILLVIAQLITQRAFWEMPTQFYGESWQRGAGAPPAEPFLFTPFTSEYDFLDTQWLAVSRGFYIEVVIAQHLILTLFALLCLSWRGSKKEQG